MGFYFYILKCFHKDGSYEFYKGHTNDLTRRMNEHKSGSVKKAFTKRFNGNFELVYTEKYKTRSEAYRRELEVKKYSPQHLEFLITNKKVKICQ